MSTKKIEILVGAFVLLGFAALLFLALKAANLGNGIVKSAVFGVICTFVALYQGYEAKATPEGVAQATTRTVVVASLGVLGMDFILTALMFSTP